MNISYLKNTGLLVLLITMAGPISAQYEAEKACDIIQSRDYGYWSERLDDYERVLKEIADSLSEAEKSRVSSYVDENWRRELFDPNSNSPENAAEERYAKRRACGAAMFNLIQEQSLQAFPPSRDDLVVRTGELLGEGWRELGEIRMMLSLLARFGPTCEDYRTLALSQRANEVIAYFHAGCPFEY